ncbi:SIMPL domain-containing protein [Sphingomonas sp. S2-65]|uniref:SIMPL domain-containing protein n=1 Tax=Sphingomonas sp. S2-65 TaxID=2903960 RepID=UPI001F17823D|nr:SIMPL domain-containing protein [Sphingomonas sp. S2-65]UYY58765.1 SIMPL domain-containing protein [Sphingomonas sp. S2-65]
MLKYGLALALLAAPTSAWAQANAVTGPVSVEIVAAGQVKVPAQRFRISVSLAASGADEAAAGTALAAARAKLMQQLGAMNIREAQADASAPSSIPSLIASFGGRSKPKFSTEVADDDSDETPQSTATETIQFDAPSRVAVNGAKPVIEANGGTLGDEVIPLLVDYVVPARQAKADALKKAQSEADAYAASLGLRRASVTRISEKQDLTAGAINFVGQIIATFAPKPEAQADDVSVQANLTVEFQLTR